MNINFNLLIQKLLPYFFILLIAYLLNSLFFLFLPKVGVDFKDISPLNLEYKKYSGFYSRIEPVQEKKQNIESLSSYELKAIYSTSSNSGWITIEKEQKSIILSKDENIDGYILKKLFKEFVIFEKLSKEYKLDLKLNNDISYETIKTNNIVIKDDNVEVNREYLNSYIKNVDKIWTDISIKELKIGDKIDGFQISRITKESAFEKLGLKEGDIIKAVNNNKLKSYSDGFNIYNNINKTKHLNIEILRNNEKMELNYEID